MTQEYFKLLNLLLQMLLKLKIRDITKIKDTNCTKLILIINKSELQRV
jgi:hypothetical protein